MKTKISPEDAEEFTKSLGQISGGAWRQISLAHKMGVPQALGLSTQEWVQDRLGGYARLASSDRKEAVVTLVLEEGLSRRKAAEILGVDPQTVCNDLNVENSTSDGHIPDETVENSTPKTVEEETTDADQESFRLSAGMTYARNAIDSLQCITRRDAERLPAFKSVAQWIKQKTTNKQWRQIISE